MRDRQRGDTIASEGYSSASEYVRELIRRDRQLKAQNRKLESLIFEGINSGEATPMTKQDWADIRAKVKRLSAEQKKNK
ncbi:type II toxin-antitoxin system ParD family antitoxin [soil metagenome]